MKGYLLTIAVFIIQNFEADLFEVRENLEMMLFVEDEKRFEDLENLDMNIDF